MARQLLTIICLFLLAHLPMGAQDSSSRYAEHSRLSSGVWVKVRVPESGVYQFSEAFLRRAGFNDPSRVRLFGYGGALQPESLTAAYLTATDDLPEQPLCQSGGSLLFWAEGPVSWSAADALIRTRNPYSNEGYYFLSDGAGDGEPLRLDSEAFSAACAVQPACYHSLYEPEEYAWYHGGRQLFAERPLTVGTPASYVLSAAGGAATLSVSLSYNGDFEADVTVNDSLVGTISRTPSLDSYSEAEARVWHFPLSALLSGDNQITLTQKSGAEVRLDYLSLCLDTPKPLAGSFPEPELVGTIASQDHHADTAVDMVIIVPASGQLTAEAERLKVHHEQQDGLRVRIVPADELYNEFSSGTPDATAYRRYMKMLYDRASSSTDRPRYLLLFGDGAWDNRMRCAEWNGVSSDDFLLCYESDNSFSHVNCYVSDDFFCMLDDEEQIEQASGGALSYLGTPDVAVGRFPVRTAADARVLVDKTIAYALQTDAGAWQNVICVMGDDGNNNTHMATADKVATQIANDHPGYQLQKIYWDAYPRVSSATGYSYPEVTRLIQEQLTNGALMMNYCGHGAAYALSHELVMRLSDFATSTTKHYPLWVTASCDIMPFDGQEENIGETVMLSERGGAIAFFGTTRTVYANYNEAMNLAFTRRVLQPSYTIGEAAREAKCELVSSGRDITPNKLQYTLLGDPALRLTCPQLQVVVDSINHLSVDTLSVQLSAGSVAEIVGHIERDGQPVSDFQGVVTATVRDALETVTCQLNDDSSDGADSAFVYTDRTKMLYQGSDSVGQGRFRLHFAVPKDISYTEGNGLITLYAINDTHRLSAHGVSDRLLLNGSGEAQTDSIGPSIYCYLNSPSFSNGGVVNATPYLVAELYDESGINASGSGIGHDLELVIDNDPRQTYVLNDYFTFDFGDYRRGTLGFRLPELSAGDHQLQLRAWDVLNNSSVSQLSFRVSADSSPGSFHVTCSRNPAGQSTSFVITHDQSITDLTVTLEVFDLAGRQLLKHIENGTSTNGVYTLEWDLFTSGGSRLSTGVYVYRIQLSAPNVATSSQANKIFIKSNN